MSVNYPIAIRNQRLQQVVNAIDGGGAHGFMRLLDSGGNVLSSFDLSFPVGIISAGILTFGGLSLLDPAAAGSGTAVTARCEDAVGNVAIFGLTVGGGANNDVVLSPTANIVAGQTIAITTATITGN